MVLLSAAKQSWFRCVLGNAFRSCLVGGLDWWFGDLNPWVLVVSVWREDLSEASLLPLGAGVLLG